MQKSREKCRKSRENSAKTVRKRCEMVKSVRKVNNRGGKELRFLPNSIISSGLVGRVGRAFDSYTLGPGINTEFGQFVDFWNFWKKSKIGARYFFEKKRPINRDFASTTVS